MKYHNMLSLSEKCINERLTPNDQAMCISGSLIYFNLQQNLSTKFISQGLS